jgi:hypothetical protein
MLLFDTVGIFNREFPMNSRFDTQQPLVLKLRASPSFVRGFGTVLVSTLLLLSLLPLSSFIFWLLIAITLGWGGHTLGYYGYYRKHPLRNACLLEKQLELAQGIRVDIDPRSFTHPLFIFLCCRLEKQTLQLFIFADALLPPVEFWQLRRRVEQLLKHLIEQ